MPVASARLKRAKRGKKERREGKIKSKKGEQGKMTAINSLSFPFLFFPSSSPHFLLTLSLSLSCLFDREKGREDQEKKRIRKRRGKKKKGNRVYCCHLSSLLSFFSFFSSFFFFFPSSLSCPLLIASVLSHVASLHFENCHSKFAVFSRCISSCFSSKVFL